MQEMQVPSLGQEDPLEKEMAIHSCILAWEMSWTVDHGKATIHGVAKELDMTLATKQQEQSVYISIPISQFVPLSSFHCVHMSILYVWSLFLPGK